MFKRHISILLLILVVLPWVATAESIDKFTTKMECVSGYYTFYVDKETDKVYLEIPRSTEAFIFQSSLPRGVGSNDLGLDRGQLGSTRLVEFSVHGEQVLLIQNNTTYVALTENEAERLSVKEAFAESVLHGFKVVARDEQSVL